MEVNYSILLIVWRYRRIVLRKVIKRNVTKSSKIIIVKCVKYHKRNTTKQRKVLYNNEMVLMLIHNNN